MSRQPDWLDERMRLGEVPPHARKEADRRTRERDSVSIQAALSESDARILSELPPDRFAAEVRRRRESAARAETAVREVRSGPSRAAWGGAALAASLALFFAVVPRVAEVRPVDESGRSSKTGTSTSGQGSTAPAAAKEGPAGSAPTHGAPERSAPQVASADPGWRSKGTPDLVIQREISPGASVPVTDSDTLGAGTRLRISVPADLPWAAVYSIDSRGKMAQHWPLQGDSAKALRAGALPRVWELDDSEGKETFVLVWSEQPFSLDAPRKAIFLDREHPRMGAGLHARTRSIQRPKRPAP